ncbi:hypothetical protein SARC_01729 [Sphaeroforma arctica JP610]|uniref:DUF305 domain-containing protein n=1 Tax=Sphaeroforma arctica JP610 TaxID=667725 RepID=A0A0L0GD09_9EUKA|nr:hypothetical protein SARC_01729 [Sphaeroforma arctica JP610]KNC86113.1 hypothetical protein SARC_01729 [Sphaeroforma arctica JP610]|eukprot:XP_014160015.1 hypothetical protein SARC_01729 [Sphaeroforma arctica JP610]
MVYRQAAGLACFFISCASALENNTFVFSVDLFASETGYYTVEGYEGLQPTLTMVRGETYTFVQKDISNWYHPLGFAYFADGAHEGVDELEEGLRGGDYPVYMINNELSELDIYEPEFTFPLEFWETNNYTVELTINDPNLTDFFYFCHVHNKMSARIVVVDNEGDQPTEAELQPLYAFTNQSGFDSMCGTTDAAQFSAQSGGIDEYCDGSVFLCGDQDDKFVQCINAIDCKMNYEMTVENYGNNSIVTFMHQMIPHHVNAVNMAKILLKEILEDNVDDPDVEVMLRDVINTQNAQITFMRGYLTELGQLEVPLCTAPESDPATTEDVIFTEESVPAFIAIEESVPASEVSEALEQSMPAAEESAPAAEESAPAAEESAEESAPSETQ